MKNSRHLSKLAVMGMGLLVLGGTPVWAQQKAPSPYPPPLATERGQEAYAMGQEIAESIKALDADIEVEPLLLGIRDLLEKKPSRLSAQALAAASVSARTSVVAKRKAKLQTLKQQHVALGRSFRDANQRKPGVVTTKSGLQYTVLTPGNGARPVPGNKVWLQYKGTLANEVEFDSSSSRTQVSVGQGLPGWTEALQLMQAGGTYRVVIPPELGYGDQGVPGKVPPGATLIYEISLEEVVK